MQLTICGNTRLLVRVCVRLFAIPRDIVVLPASPHPLTVGDRTGRPTRDREVVFTSAFSTAAHRRLANHYVAIYARRGRARCPRCKRQNAGATFAPTTTDSPHDWWIDLSFCTCCLVIIASVSSPRFCILDAESLGENASRLFNVLIGAMFTSRIIEKP